MDTRLEITADNVVLDDWDRIFDVRPHASTAAAIPGSEAISFDELTHDLDDDLLRSRVLVVCDIGMRSKLAAASLIEAGAAQARSLEGGIDAWRRAGRQLTHTAGLSDGDLERYDRQIKLPGMGTNAQAALGRSRVAVVGAGGLGSPVLSYLAGAGVGTIDIIDDDAISVSNLHRQPLFRTEDVGEPKAGHAARFVSSLNPSVSVNVVQERLSPENAEALLAGVDLAIDASDNYPTRHAINDTCVRLGMPLVSGAVYRYEGQVFTMVPPGPCYRCVFPGGATDGPALDCSIVGVLGPVVGTIGSMMATAAIRALADRESVNGGRLVVFDGLTGETTTVSVARRPDCPAHP